MRLSPFPVFNAINYVGLMNTVHIFTGEITTKGAKQVAQGFHHISGTLGGAARILEKVPYLGNKNIWGAYRAKVALFDGTRWIEKNGFSTMFHNHWSPTRVMDEILHARDTGTIVGREFRGFSTNGMPIIGYLNSSGTIRTAWPNI
jgi:hypothetical protein